MPTCYYYIRARISILWYLYYFTKKYWLCLLYCYELPIVLAFLVILDCEIPLRDEILHIFCLKAT